MNSTTKATGSFSIHCAQSSDDELEFLYYSNRSNKKGRSSSIRQSGLRDNLNPKTTSVSPFEPLTKDRNYDPVNGGGKISPLPQNEYEIWAKRKRDIAKMGHSFHHSHFRPVVISQSVDAVVTEDVDSATAGRFHTFLSDKPSMEQFSIEKLKLENEYLHKKVQKLEWLLQQQQQQQQQAQYQQHQGLSHSPIIENFNHYNDLTLGKESTNATSFIPRD